MLPNPFPTQQQQMVAQNPSPPQGGNIGRSHHGDASSSATQVFMCKEMVSLINISKNYDTHLENHANGGATNNTSISTPPSSTPLQIESPVIASVLHLLKGTF
jgi:hypothetical protein